MQNIKELAEKTFGAVCYAGFDRVLWAVEDEQGLARGTLTNRQFPMKYRSYVLNKVLKKIHDAEEASQVIELITDGSIRFTNEEIILYKNNY